MGQILHWVTTLILVVFTSDTCEDTYEECVQLVPGRGDTNTTRACTTLHEARETTGCTDVDVGRSVRRTGCLPSLSLSLTSPHTLDPCHVIINHRQRFDTSGCSREY